MSERPNVDRRGFLTRGLAVASVALLGGCDSELSEQPWVKRILDKAEAPERREERACVPGNDLALNSGGPN